MPDLKILFPHDSMRRIQDTVVSDVYNALKERKSMVIHAPTGIGKTASVLAPALSFAMDKDLTIFFLTSRQTQHYIAVETLKKIKKKHNADFGVADIIGKKWMCLQEIEALNSSDFIEYCKKLRDENQCEFYLNTRKASRSPTLSAEKNLGELKILSPLHVNEVINHCKNPKLCPYEMVSMLAKDAKVIIADYNSIFNTAIRDGLFGRADKKLENSIIIVDEGHNLPARARELLTFKISTAIIDRAIKEASKFELFNVLSILNNIKEAINQLGADLNFNNEEKLIRRYEFTDKINNARKSKAFGTNSIGKSKYEEIISELSFASNLVKEKQKQSYLASIAKFMEAWENNDRGFARILSMDFKNHGLILNYRCLDPSLITKDAIERSYATIIMSGTLTPTNMYKNVLGFPNNSSEKTYSNPFPKENRLCLIIPETTTKFTRRGNEEYKKIAEVCNKIVSNIPGNAALFFPSYDLRDKVYKEFYGICKRKMIIEKQHLSKEEKESMLEEFKQHKDKGAVLLAVSTGNFGEGIDLPGDFLKGVVIVGLPLEKPDLETKELIDYYEEKFGDGVNYGYVFPAITKCLQNAGRCIRTETDKGVIVFLDERFAWDNYLKCLPMYMDFKITKIYEERIGRFFSGSIGTVQNVG